MKLIQKIENKFVEHFSVELAWQIFIRSLKYFSIFVILIILEMLNVLIPNSYLAWFEVLEIYSIGWIIALLFLMSCIPKQFIYIRLFYGYAILYVIAFLMPGHYFDIYAEGAEANLYDALYWNFRLAYLIVCALIYVSIKIWRVSFKPVVLPFIKRCFSEVRLLRWQ